MGHTIGYKAVKGHWYEYWISTAVPFDELKQKLEAYHANGYASGFEESDIALRTEPKLSLPTARSIIAIAVGYPNKPKVHLRVLEVIAEAYFRASWVKIIIQLCVND